MVKCHIAQTHIGDFLQVRQHLSYNEGQEHGEVVNTKKPP